MKKKRISYVYVCLISIDLRSTPNARENVMVHASWQRCKRNSDIQTGEIGPRFINV